MSYYEAAKSWYEENKHKFPPLRRKVFRMWLKIMKEAGNARDKRKGKRTDVANTTRP